MTGGESGLSLGKPGTGNATLGTYTVVLNSEPTGCNIVVVNVANDNADVAMLPTTLAQDVTITLMLPAAAVPLEHGWYRFGPAGTWAAVRAAVLVRYDGQHRAGMRRCVTR